MYRKQWELALHARRCKQRDAPTNVPTHAH